MSVDTQTPAASWSPAAIVMRSVHAWAKFWFSPVEPAGLHAIRFLAGLLFLFWLAPLASEYNALFGLEGWFDRAAYEDASSRVASPYPIGWSFVFLAGHSDLLLQLCLWGSLAVFALFTIGVAPRLTSILSWVVIVSHMANPALHYDADWLLAILAFYLMIGYLLYGQWSRPLSIAERVVGPWDSLLSPLRRDQAAPSYAANLAVRLVQVHFAIVMLTSGLHKLQFGEWWSGAAFWYWMYPPTELTQQILRDMRPGAEALITFLSVATYAMLAWQIAFPFFAFRPRWRPLLLGGGLVAWIGAMVVFRLPYFGPLTFLVCLSYLTPAEWAWMLRRLHREQEPGAAAEAPPAAVTKFRPRVKADAGK